MSSLYAQKCETRVFHRRPPPGISTALSSLTPPNVAPHLLTYPQILLQSRKTLGRMCHQAGLGDEPRKVFEQLQQIRIVDVVLPTRSGVEIRRRCVSRPTEHQSILLQRLGLHLPATFKIAAM